MQNIFKSHSDIIIRTPLWDIDKLHNFNVDKLVAALDDTFFCEALWLASPVLYEEAQKWKNGTLNKKQSQHVVYSLSKYYQRLCTRVIPFGLFAACSSVKLGNISKVEFEGALKRFTRLDMEFVCRLINKIEKNVFYQRDLYYRLNSSLYEVDNQLRYIEYKYIGAQINYTTAAVENTEYIQRVINFLNDGEKQFDNIVNILVDDDISYEEASEFINLLIQDQILVSNLEASVIGENALVALITELRKTNGSNFNSLLNVLSEINSMLIALDENINNQPTEYAPVIEKIKTLEVEFDVSKLFQVDVYRPVSNTSNIEISHVNSLLSLVGVLFPFVRFDQLPNVKNFIEKFRERYNDEEVELTKLLDTDIGIGYPVNSQAENTPLVDDFDITDMATHTTTLNNVNSYFLQLIINASVKGSYTVDLADDNKKIEEAIKLITNNLSDIPPSVNLQFRYITENGKRLLLFENIACNSAIDLIGRFAHTNTLINATIQNVAEHERSLYPDHIFADIIHLPEARAGNVVSRPAISPYQIPFISKPTIESDYIVNINDIMISISNDNRILLRSKKNNKYIIPRIYNAHSYSFSKLPVYRFLCDMQNQTKFKYVAFNWGPEESFFKFLPRVIYKDIILSLASWKINSDTIQGILELHKIDDLTIEAIENWRNNNNNIPDKVLLVEGDFELYVDFKNILSVKTFLNEVKEKNVFTIKEFLQEKIDEENIPAVNHFILPLLRVDGSSSGYIANSDYILPRRNFLPGSDVVFLKIYGGPKILERLLINKIAPLLQDEMNNNIIDKWFFIRYADSDNHIRIRCFLKNPDTISILLKKMDQLLSDYKDNHLIYKIAIETYERELKRYHGEMIALSEDIFCTHTLLAIDILRLIYEQPDTENYRWLACLKCVDVFLENAGLNLAEKHNLIKSIRESFFTEFGGSIPLNRTLSSKYRNNKKLIETTLMDKVDDQNNFSAMLSTVINNRTKFIEENLDKIKVQKEKDVLMDLLGSYIHMLLNRLLIANPRKHELVIYDFLERTYNSQLKR